MEFYFNYDAADKSRFEAEESGWGLAPLIECRAELLKEWGLWKSFIQEYRDDRQTCEEWCLETSETEIKAALPSEPPTLEEVEKIIEDTCTWGPSQPFAPAEAKDWAAKWIMILDLLSEEEAKHIFPFGSHLHEKDSTWARNRVVQELQKIIRQADCATGHGVHMTMEMEIG